MELSTFPPKESLPPPTIISVYQVCKNLINKYGDTAWLQQRHGLNMDSRTHIHPRKAFIDNLTIVVQAFQCQGHDIIVGGDFNETLMDMWLGLLRLATATNLLEPWHHLHLQHAKFNTQISGYKRIDSVLLSHCLMDSVRSISYALFGHITNSDHHPLLIDFDTKRLFGNNTAMVFPPQFCGVKANDVNSVTTYVAKLHTHLKSNGAFDLKTALDKDQANASTAELANKMLGDRGNSAEQACKRHRPEIYSTTLSEQRIKVGALRAQANNLKYIQQDWTDSIKARLTRASIHYLLPSTLANTNTSLKTK